MLTRIRNACGAGRDTVDVPRSEMKAELARILKREGYIADYTTEGQGGKKTLRLFLRYTPEREPVIQGLQRVSKPGLRRYVAAAKVPRVLRGMGVAILSTSSGILTDREARHGKVGGELVCKVW
jgi:small subunit ribosomal protein S8